MQLISFRDTCVIERGTGTRDEWDNPVRTTIYAGECLYEEAGTGYSRSIITRAPSVYLPSNDVMVMINDHVTINTEQGRVLEGNVESVRDINLPWRANIRCTKIELKQAQGE